jgi:23S rRNA (uracil1939-C5)-methyltransferase
MVEDLFRRMLPNQPWKWLSAPEDALRHRIQLHWDGKNLGFHQRKRNTVVPINSCPAASPNISSAIPRLEEALACHVLPSRPQRWELTTGTPPAYVFAIDEKQRAWVLEPDGWHKSEENVIHHYSGHRLIHKPGGFFQVTAKWAMEAFCQVLSQWNIQGDTLYDLYGGVGLFSVILGANFNKCTLVESDSSSIAFAELNLTEAKLQHQCIESDVAVWMPDCLGDTGDVVLLDPPRSGLAPGIVEKLLKSQASTLILIGCDGAAFCRDINRLGQVWGLKQLAVIDLFPMTVHVECIGLLQKNELVTTS